MSRSSQRAVPEWFFFHGGPGAPRYGGDPTKHAVDHDTETFVREVLQNANDQRLPNDDPVDVTFRFVDLEGNEVDSFLEALGWTDGLEDRLAAVLESGDRYESFVERVTGSDPRLRLLVVDDRNTTGLTGEWGESSNYAALVRDELYSNKQDETAGGSYGVGKSVLWTFSEASTVLFNSVPAESVRDRSPPRFVGRTKLPTHRLDDGRDYQGAGWFCRARETDDGTRPESLWGPDASDRAHQLHLGRPDVSGTSAMVVGYRDPTRDERPPVDGLADDFLEAAVKYFWPAIYRGDLEVHVETPEERREAELGDVESIRPFVECYADRYDDRDQLETPGDTAGYDIDVALPARSDGTETPTGKVRIAARLAAPTDDDTLQNRVAMFRGTGMVVKYLDQSRVAFADRDFHAVLAAGEARPEGPPTEADLAVDEFFRYAEPPTHDDWISTEQLREQYKYGFRTALEDTLRTVREALRDLISRPIQGSREFPDKIGKRFPIHGEGRRRPLHGSERAFEIDVSSRLDADRWTFQCVVEPTIDRAEPWRAELSIVSLGEDGRAQDRVPIRDARVVVGDAEMSIDGERAIVTSQGPAERVVVQGESTPVVLDGGSRETAGTVRMEVDAVLGGDRQ